LYFLTFSHKAAEGHSVRQDFLHENLHKNTR
jgi:hypothetical protein